MATVEAREADPDLASPAAHSTSNRYPFVTTDTTIKHPGTISPPQEAEDVLETKFVRASASDQGVVYWVHCITSPGNLCHDMQFFTRFGLLETPQN